MFRTLDDELVVDGVNEAGVEAIEILAYVDEGQLGDVACSPLNWKIHRFAAHCAALVVRAELGRETAGSAAVHQAEVYALGRRALVFGDLFHGHVVHRGRRKPVEVHAPLEGPYEGGVLRDLGQDPQLYLGVVGDHEHVSVFGDEAAAELVLVRYLLDIRSGTGEAPGGDAALEEVRVDAARLRAYEIGVGLQVGA